MKVIMKNIRKLIYTAIFAATGMLLVPITTNAAQLLYFYSATGTIVNEQDSNGNMSSYLTRGVRFDGTSATYAVSNKKDIMALLDATGTVSQKYNYTAYGVPIAYSDSFLNPKSKTSTNVLSITQNPYTYSGYYTDSESGNYYLNARYYNPVIGSFLTMDSYNKPNRYMYVGGEPISYTDPFGHGRYSDLKRFMEADPPPNTLRKKIRDNHISALMFRNYENTNPPLWYFRSTPISNQAVITKFENNPMLISLKIYIGGDDEIGENPQVYQKIQEGNDDENTIEVRKKMNALLAGEKDRNISNIYRGIRIPEDKFKAEQYDVGEPFTGNPINSFSRDKDVALKFATMIPDDYFKQTENQKYIPVCLEFKSYKGKFIEVNKLYVSQYEENEIILGEFNAEITESAWDVEKVLHLTLKQVQET